MNNSSDTGTRVPTYKCAFCQGKIVSCNCENGFKNAVEASLREQIAHEIEIIMGNAQRDALIEMKDYPNMEAMKAWSTAVNRCISIVRKSNDL